jgi:hypothetical protein
MDEFSKSFLCVDDEECEEQLENHLVVNKHGKERTNVTLSYNHMKLYDALKFEDASK